MTDSYFNNFRIVVFPYVQSLMDGVGMVSQSISGSIAASTAVHASACYLAPYCYNGDFLSLFHLASLWFENSFGY